jgi:hypothetical protein
MQFNKYVRLKLCEIKLGDLKHELHIFHIKMNIDKENKERNISEML